MVPDAMAIASSMSAKLLPALDGPAMSILCPCLNTPWMSSSAFGGRPLSFAIPSFLMTGMSSLVFSIHSRHSSQDSFPRFVPIRNCFLPPRLMPGSRESLEGFLLAVSMVSPFFSQILYKNSTRCRYSSALAASILTIA